ncbi:hypothetical protein [Nakamurella leprariae]|uniref:Uncharacterized protein n=1 Tax=Nakamurella leprariae TaxID=2803911 RepID=A0A938YFD0_9ACTN|nr:hypothetical protein [Nakamurella leprariae]MBM9468516.1 hypothetical protein [Nakamurella leprariae]
MTGARDRDVLVVFDIDGTVVASAGDHHQVIVGSLGRAGAAHRAVRQRTGADLDVVVLGDGVWDTSARRRPRASRSWPCRPGRTSSAQAPSGAFAT